MTKSSVVFLCSPFWNT